MIGEKDEEWSGKAEQLLQQQLKNVQEECRYAGLAAPCTYLCLCSVSHRQLREACRHSDGIGAQLSQHCQVSPVTPRHRDFIQRVLLQANSTHSLLQSSSSKLRLPADVSPPSLPTSQHTPLPSHHSTPSQNTHITPSLNPQLSLSMASLSSVRSTQSELAPTMTSSRHHQLHTPRYTARQVSSTPHDKQAGGKRGGKKKGTVTHSSSQRAASSEASKGGPAPFKIDSTSSEWQQQEYYRKAGKRVVPTQHVLDSGYSSGTGPTPRVNLRLSTGQPSAGNERVTSRNTGPKMSTLAPFSGSPSLSHPVCVSIPASVHVVGRGGNRWGEESKENLERGRVKQLEHEVTVLEQQLSEKTQAARSHVEDLTCLRSELARERSALARVSVNVNGVVKISVCG